jgi:hypothetical protein
VTQVASGSFTGDAFDADVQTTTNFAQGGNYTRTAKLAARRVGDCPAADGKSKTS